MKKIKQIHRPEFTNAVRLTPLQLNALRYEEKHTLLTPELMASLYNAATSVSPSQPIPNPAG